MEVVVGTVGLGGCGRSKGQRLGAIVGTTGLGDHDRHHGVGAVVDTMGLGDCDGHRGVGRLWRAPWN